MKMKRISISQLRHRASDNQTAIAHLSAQYSLGAGMKAVGQIVTEHDVYLDCDFDGSIQSEGLVEIDVNSKTQADITARSIKLSGWYQGRAVAREQFTALASATLRGSITAPLLEIDQGAIVAAEITSQPRDNR